MLLNLRAGVWQPGGAGEQGPVEVELAWLAGSCCRGSAPVWCSPALAASWSSTAHVPLESGTQILHIIT